MPENNPPITEQPTKDPSIDQLLQQLADIKLNTVPKKDYEQALETNGKLIKQIATERPTVQPAPSVETKEDIIKRCRERTAKLAQGTSLDSVKGLVDNYRDMQKLNMETAGVEESVVEALEGVIEESKGNADYFNTIMSTRFKQTK